MATKSKIQVEKALTPQEQPQRFQLSEIGYQGYNIFSGVSTDELQRELNFPYNIKVFKEMMQHTAVNSCLSLYENLISKVTWRIAPPTGATDKEKKECEFIQQCFDDMDVSFKQVIRDALSSNSYGFSVLEKVYRKRNPNSGSMYSDNKIGLKKIALRNQETIEKFIFDEAGCEVIGVKQNLSGCKNLFGSSNLKNEVVLPRSKFVLVTVGRNRSDPYGKSPLTGAYLSWRYLMALQEIESAGVAKDLAGIPVLSIPAQYMSADATADQKILYENFKNIARNLQSNSQSAVVLPSACDPETRTPLFKLELLSSQGGKSFDTTEIKTYYQNQIYTTLFADVLLLGQGGSGSFALGQIKNSLTGSAVESMLDNIVDCFNRDVIRQLYELNGMDVSRMGKLDYDNLHNADLETISKAFQRIASVGLVEKDREFLNYVRELFGIDVMPEDMEPRTELIDSNSVAGKAMGSPFEGTRTSSDGTNNNDNNLDNAA